MKMKLYIILLFTGVILSSCAEKEIEPISQSLGKPQPVTDIVVQNKPGGAVISYRIPQAEDLLLVKAVYTLSNGKQSETSVSFYDNNLEVNGFNDMNEHKVQIYAINRAQVMSDPVDVVIKPEKSPLQRLTETFEIISDFGGARFSWENELKAPVSIDLLAEDSIGNLKVMKVVYTESLQAYQSLRGYKPSPMKFAAVVRDYWNNTSDTIYPPEVKLTPMFEEKLDKSKMHVMKLNNDASFANWEGLDFYLIDDDKTTFGHSANSSIPAAFTIDLGCTVKLSRFLNWQRYFSDTFYNWGNPKKMNVYGRAEKPASNGNWNEWEFIMECEIVKPSGSPSGTVTDEDKAAAEAGHEFTFDLDQKPIRYLRFIVTETFGGTTFCHPCEFSFFGEIISTK